MIPIVICFNAKYFLPALVCCYSLESNALPDTKYEVICLLEDQLSEEQYKILLDKKIFSHIEFHFKVINNEQFCNISVSDRFGKASLYRLMLPELLPQYDKVIYHDCDMIIRQDFTKLYYLTDLDKYYMGVIYEPTLNFQKEMVHSVGCQVDRYFNSGFLFFNLKKMRQDKISYKMIEEAQNLQSDFIDQDALNIICKDMVLAIGPEYNFIRTMVLPQYKKDFLRIYTEKQWQYCLQHGNIHYTGSKPWNSYTVMFSLWWDYFYKVKSIFGLSIDVPSKLRMYYKLEKNPVSSTILDGLKYIKRKF